MPAAYIDDGYTETATIGGIDDASPAVRFRFRPATAGEFGEYAQRLEFANDVDANRLSAEFVAAKLVDWDLRDADGTRAVITAGKLMSLHPPLLLDLFRKVVGEVANDDLTNLVEGVRLELTAPHIAARDCGHCEQFVYDEATGLPTPHRRSPGTFAPCRYGINQCPKGTPEVSRALSDKNRSAYRHYQTCQALGRFPHDAVVERNAALIHAAEQNAERE
jgi:hypothetical protein